MTEARFTVDTHLFRELGELLVGRDSTALVELIKNSYDADATRVVVNGYALDQPDEGRISIDDNGLGMRSREFIEGFLRIASRLREQGPRSSLKHKRRYTGAKGIGRLAAHKLARVLEVYSVASVNGGDSLEAVRAQIDWDEVESRPTLDDVPPLQLAVEPLDGATARTGTVITLRRLRRPWTATERGRFI